MTGAGKGIGRSCAEHLAAAGAEVFAFSRTAADLESLKRDIEDRGGRAEWKVVDVTDDDEVRVAVEEVGPVDVLINSAGANRPMPFVDTPMEVVDELVTLNFRSLFLMTQLVVRQMLSADRKGAIVNITSQLGHVGYAGRSVYTASKHAVEGLTKALAVELAPHGIRVNSVAPTFIATPMTAVFFERKEFLDEVLGRIPAGRLGTPDEVAEAALFLASPAASLITGASLLVDGGWTAQ